MNIGTYKKTVTVVPVEEPQTEEHPVEKPVEKVRRPQDEREPAYVDK